MNFDEIDSLGTRLRNATPDENPAPDMKVNPSLLDRLRALEPPKRPPPFHLVKSFPDLFSLGHAIQFAKDADHMEDVARLEALEERSKAFGEGGHGTHLPVLAAVMQKVEFWDGSASSRDDDYPLLPVLECGAGFYSTTLLNAMCRSGYRKLYTLESDPAWLAKFAHLASEDHVLQRVVGWSGDPWGEAIKGFNVKRWSVVFIDHREKIDRIVALRNHADYIVVHDTRNTFHAGLDDLLDTFEHRYDYVEMAPCTTVVSMTQEFAL